MGRKHDGILWSILDYQSDFNTRCHDILRWKWLWNRVGNSHNFRCIMSNIMTNITTNIANGVDKVVNDVTTAAEAALRVLAEASFQYALQLAFNALLFWLIIQYASENAIMFTPPSDQSQYSCVSSSPKYSRHFLCGHTHDWEFPLIHQHFLKTHRVRYYPNFISKYSRVFT